MDAISFNDLPDFVVKLYNKLTDIERLLLENGNRNELQEDQLLTVEQAADLLSLSVPTIYTLVSKNQLPVNKRGKRLYFSKQEITSWIKEGRKKTTSEIELMSKGYVKAKKH